MIDFRNRTLNGKPVFSQAELSLILGVYGEKVKAGVWRDYAIDSLSDMAIFSVFRATAENPVYQIAKVKRQGLLKPSQYVVYSGNKTVRQGSSLSDVLSIFDDLS